MGLEAILARIEASGKGEEARVRAEAETRTLGILAEAVEAEAAERERIKQEALSQAANERSATLYQARMEALGIVGRERGELVAVALARTRLRLANLRLEPGYPGLLEVLAREAFQALPDEETEASTPVLEIDPRDAALAEGLQRALGPRLTISASLDCWGGVAAHSADGRIRVTNTLEARLLRALPFLERDWEAGQGDWSSLGAPASTRAGETETAWSDSRFERSRHV